MSGDQASYVTLDVFASERFKGNPLAIVKTGDHKLSQQQKQQIAKEFNFSETVFLHPSDHDGRPRADIFTPVNEMEFAGHPIIGTGHLLFRELLANDASGSTKLTITTKAGPVAISYDPTSQVVSAGVPHNIHIHQQEATLSRILPAQATLMAASDLHGVRDTSPVVSMVKGVTYALVDLTERADLFAGLVTGPSPELELDESWTPSFTGVMYYQLLETRPEGNIAVWELRVRMIAINLEDPACGSGGCSLGAYIALTNSQKGRRHRLFISQGSEMGRQSHIIVEVTLNEEKDAVQKIDLAGQAAFVSEGKIYVD
ncbi:phenazine biosynthesis-like protein [Aspergillus pseudotamarii]|uniref:Phenazine biosynthesis-like protein n=1 Tax=Aspergillus pseudotamarii TaxID=132259 RepID=A0A5N6T8W2_ASPPS|nr:phenazine biosynthesis-like protein [Aspergillus pseudotamarii]KAE8142814.1 phenazine biosynthesis-like protein [Aspergillus pseudotamarii]